MLAFQSAEALTKLFTAGLKEWTVNTIVDPAAFRRELATIQTRGYAIADEESEIGVRSLAAPVWDHFGNVIAAVSIAGPAQRLPKKALVSFVPDIISAAESISVRLGYKPLVAGRLIRSGRR